MKKQIVKDLETCIEVLLTSEELGSNVEYINTVKVTVEQLIIEFDLYMLALNEILPHLSETQQNLISLVIDEYNLTHLPKLLSFQKLILNKLNSLKDDDSIIH